MKLLLDTRVLLWFMQDARALSRDARRLIERADELHVSSVSLWEASIKVGLGKLELDMDDLEARLNDAHVFSLPVTWEHAKQVRRLPMLHRDPFDRMLIAQALSEPLHLLTHNVQLRPYSDLVLLV